MTPDELRRSIINELDGMVSEFIHPNEFGGYDVDYGQLADVVMPVLAEALAAKDDEIQQVRRNFTYADHAATVIDAEWEKADDESAELRAERDRLSALLRGMARRVGQIRRDAETNVGHLAHQADTLMDLTADLGHARTELEQERVRRQNLAALTAPDVFAAARLAEAEQTITEVRESETATRLRWSRRYRAARDHLAELRERAVVLPEDMDSQIHAALNESPHLSDFEALAALGIVARLIESWRPSTGDTRTRKPIDDATKAAVLAAIEAGKYIACGDGPEYWPDCERCEATGRITECPDCDGFGKSRPAALPEGNAEQTGDPE